MKKVSVKSSTNLPILKTSKGSPSTSSHHSPRGRGRTAKSTDEIHKRVGLHLSPGSPTVKTKRTISPGNGFRKSLSPSRVPIPVAKGGVRYITEDMIKKQAKEENLDLISTLNLNLSKDGSKKIKYIENLDRLRKLEILDLSNNMIEKMERMDKLLKLKELDLSFNMITKIEGLENLSNLQVLNLTGNHIEHIPVWFPKKMKALRNFKIPKNRLDSLSEVSKLKALSDLTHLDISNNPLSQLSHSRIYIIFHIRTLEILDNQEVSESDRSNAHTRFAQDEVEKLEHLLEEQEKRNKILEESHNKSVHELSAKDASTTELRLKDKESQDKIKELEQELKVKEDLLMRKTSDLTKASEKHYQLEQELAFFKIDSKFDSLGEAPPTSQIQSGDDSGLIGESPYIGRARYKSNQYAQEGSIIASPQKISISSVESSFTSPSKGFSPVISKLQQSVDNKLVEKQKELELADKKLKALMDDLEWTEKKLVKATQEMKKMAQRETPDYFKGDGKFKLRQRLARKMSNVTQMRDMATQVESEIDRKQQKLEEDKSQLGRIKEELNKMNKSDPAYTKKYSSMVDKEQQISESNEAYNDLKDQLNDMMENINRETQDIKKLEQQLRDEQIEKNEEMRQELDDVVSGLQVYINNVKQQAEQQKKDCEDIIKERDELENKVHQLEQELSLLDAEATEIPLMQKKLYELEASFQASKDQNRSLREQLERQPTSTPYMGNHKLEDKLEAVETEARNLRKSLTETERKAQSEKKFLEKQVQLEKERAERATKKARMSGSPDRDFRKVTTQLEALKAQNTSLMEEIESYRRDNQNKDINQDNFKPGDLKRKLKDFSKIIKAGKVPVIPNGADDIIGNTMKDLQNHIQDQLNKSSKEIEKYKKEQEKAEIEMKTLKDQLKEKHENIPPLKDKKKLKNTGIMTNEDTEKRKLLEVIKHLERALKDAEERAKQPRTVTKIVYSPSSESSDKASSLYSDEKELYEELQRELMDLKRYMKGKVADDEQRLMDAETEAAKWQTQLQVREKEFEAELDRQRHETDILREKQEARIQVIAEDLENAQKEADLLQQILDAKDLQLQEEYQQVDLSNQITTSQEEELARLYDILESQRKEIEKLNHMLDHLAVHGPDGVGPSFDDELWRVRQEVNNLKETLAMQSAYVQTMPEKKPGVSFGTQADFIGPDVGPPMYSKYPKVKTTSPRPSIQDLPDATSSPTQPVRASVIPPTVNRSPAIPPTANRSSAIPPTSNRSSAIPPTANRSSIPSSGGFILEDPPIKPIELTSRPNVARPQSYQHNPVSPPKHNKYPREQTIPKMIDSYPIDPVVAYGPIVPPPVNIPYPEKRYIPTESVIPKGDFSVPSHPQPTVLHNTRNKQFTGPTITPSTKISSTPKSVANKDQVPFSAPNFFFQNNDGVTIDQTDCGATNIGSVSDIINPTRITSTTQHTPGNNKSTQGKARRRLSLEPPSAFEPVHRPAPYNPIQNGLPQGVETSHMIPSDHYSKTSYTQHDPTNMPAVQNIGQPVSSNVPHTFQNHPATVVESYAPYSSGPNYPVSQQTVHPHYPVPQYPTAQQLSDNYVLTRQHGTGFHPVSGPIPIGNHLYTPSGVAQPIEYLPNRIYYPAKGDYPARFYYPVVKKKKRSTKHIHRSFTPVASGTPVKKSKSKHGVPFVVFEESLIDPPSPIRPVMESSPPRGILKQDGGVEDESYLFCNVTEHHELEDYIAELQDKLKSLKSKLIKYEETEERRLVEEDSRLVHRLQNELEERRDELEGLDLAIERQKRNLKEMHREEKRLLQEKESAKQELKQVKKNNDKLNQKLREKEEEETSFDEFMAKSRQNYLQEEIECLEKTLTKRQGQLRETERLLKECKNDLKEAKEQARETIERYDTAKTNLQETIKETNEIEKRANETGTELVKLSEEVSVVKGDLRKITHERSQQEQILKEINKIIQKKDIEYKDLETKVKTANQSLQKLQLDLVSASEREKNMVDTLRDSDDLLIKRRSELNRMKDQLDSQKLDIETLNQEMGKTRTQLQLIQEDKERKQSEFQKVMREADIQLASKHRQIREEKDMLATVEQQNKDLNEHLKSKRIEIQKLKDQIQEEEEVFQKLLNSVNKNKTELKHTYDMQQFEKTELENLKVQHSQKLAELEKTQRSLAEEKIELDNLTIDVNRKNSELERLRQMLERDREEIDRLTTDKTTLQDRIGALTREKDMMSDSCKNFDDKLNQMKRNHSAMEEKIENNLRKSDSLDNEIQQREKELEECNKIKAGFTKEIQSLKHHLKESKQELKCLQDNIQDAEDQLHTIDQDLRHKFQQRDDAKLEFDSLNDAIRKSRTVHEEMLRQEHTKRQELDNLLRHLHDHDLQFQEAQKTFHQLKQDSNREEDKLNRLISSANIELDSIRLDLTSKQEELNETLLTVEQLKKESQEIQSNEEKFKDLEKQIKELSKELIERNNEKTELANALTLSYEQLQKVRKENAEDQEKYIKERAILETTLQDIQAQLELTKQDLNHVQERNDIQVGELLTLATAHFHRANLLNNKLHDIRNSVDILNKIKPEDIQEDKENRLIIKTEPSSFREKWQREAMKEKLVQEQDYLRYQLRQQMLRHAESMEKTRLASEETIDGLKRKLNNLQDVLFKTNESSDLLAIEDLTRSRSRSPFRSTNWSHRRQTPSPLRRSHLYKSTRRSRSGSPHLPEREFV